MSEPVLPVLPSSKEKKYDRQLRLWAASGQAALEEAHILLLNSGSGVVGIETLKNLVLPGIGEFTIVDSAETSEADLGVNFFLEKVGGSRAQQCCELLLELNPDVKGHYVNEESDTFLSRPGSLSPFSHIIFSEPISTNARSTLIAFATEHHIPLVQIDCTGYYSQFSLSLPPSFPIVDTHPDPTTTSDLRLLKPWSELLDLVKLKTSNLSSLSDHEHGHIPYVLLLLHYLEEWKASHEGLPPQNFKEKIQFRKLVDEAARTDNPEGGEENFEEAVEAVVKSLNPPELSSGVREVITAPESQNLSASSANFWIIASAIRSFHEKHGVLPLPGSVPDMKAQSADYIQLQNVYKSKARKDCAEVISTVRKLESAHGISNKVPDSEVEAFCKGAAFVKLLRGRPLLSIDEEFASQLSAKNAARCLNELGDKESVMPIHFAFLTQDYARSKYGVTEISKLTDSAAEIVSKLRAKGNSASSDTEAVQNIVECLQELDRTDGGELHNIAALTGGLVAQEMIKIITKQYIPIDDTCVFDGIKSKAGVIKHC